MAMQESIDPGLYLDIYNAISHSTFSTLKDKMKLIQKHWTKNDLMAYQATLYGGDAEKGKEILIRNEAAQCLRCHAIYGRGGIVGPPLEHIADRLDRKSLLTSLINPNANIAIGYGVVILTLKDEEELSGILTGENKQELILKTGNKEPRIIQRAEIKSMEMLPSGMMNMKEVLDQSQIRDLIAFLVKLKKENEGKLF
jgi:putative heme-binding domain-containing protein